MKKLLISAAVLISLLNGIAAFAYVPPYWMIMSKLAESHGKGIYVVSQDVIFQGGNEPLIVNERWTIANENEMRLEVTGRRQMKDRIRLTVIYDGTKRTFIDENGVRKSARLAPEFFEKVFHFRFSKNIKPYLVSAQVVPSETLKSEPHKYSKTKPHADPEPFVRLARTGGVVAYNIGHLWIEQDQFVVRKLRYPTSNVTILANDYQTFSQGLRLPKEREVTFNQHNVRIVVNSVSSIPNSAQNKAKLNVKSLNFGENPQLATVLPEDQAIREFYSRLR